MLLGSEAPDAGGVSGGVRQRMAWTCQPDGGVRQSWETSPDGGKTWSVVFDGRYVRRVSRAWVARLAEAISRTG